MPRKKKEELEAESTEPVETETVVVKKRGRKPKVVEETAETEAKIKPEPEPEPEQTQETIEAAEVSEAEQETEAQSNEEVTSPPEELCFDGSHEAMLNYLRQKGEVVTCVLVNGKLISGKIYGFDKFTLQIRNYSGIHLVFKAAICNISPFIERPQQKYKNDKRSSNSSGGRFSKPYDKKGNEGYDRGYKSQERNNDERPSFRRPVFKHYDSED